MFAGEEMKPSIRTALLASVAELDRRYGRFMQPDPLGYGDGMDWYNYVGGNPVNRVDPSGLDGGPSDLSKVASDPNLCPAGTQGCDSDYAYELMKDVIVNGVRSKPDYSGIKYYEFRYIFGKCRRIWRKRNGFR